MLVRHIQSRLQDQYDIHIPYQVEHFVSHDADLARHLSIVSDADDNTTAGSRDSIESNSAPETLFISQADDTLEFTLYLDREVLHSASCIAPSEPHDRLTTTGESLDDVCTVLEGVSHAVCLLWHAHHDRQLRALDMELQAEVDKYTLLIAACGDADSRSTLHRQLFDNAAFLAPVGSELYARYKTASDHAANYCNWLSQQFPSPADQDGLYRELARFYRLSGSGKFDYIKRLH